MPVNAPKHIFINYSTAFRAGMEGMEDVDLWKRFARRIPSTGKKNSYRWFGLFPEMREWFGDRQAKELDMEEFEVPNRKFEITIEIDEDEYEDGNGLDFVEPIRGMGRATSKLPNRLVFEVLNNGKTRLGYDNVPLFSANHPVGDGVISNYDAGANEPWLLIDARDDVMMPIVYQPRRAPRFAQKDKPTDDAVFYKGKRVYGADRRDGVAPGVYQKAFLSELDLNSTNFDSAVAQMMSYENANGETLDISPSVLVTTPANRAKAKALLEAQNLASGASNTNFKFVDVLITNKLKIV